MEKLDTKLNNSSPSVQKDQKLQSTVRFNSSQYREVERIKRSCGISFAEAVRRLVNEGLERLGGKKQ